MIRIKVGLFFTLLLCFNSGYSQKIDSVAIDNDLKVNLLRQLGSSWLVEKTPMTIDEYYEYFKPAYLNNDTLVDFVYYGPSGGEPFKTEIYLNKSGRLVLIKEGMGSIYSYSKPFPDSPAFLHFVEWGCCADPHNVYQLWTLIDDSIIDGDKYHFLEETILPENFNFKFSIRVKNTPYTLRATPEIINDKFNYDYDKGNIIAEYGTGDTGHVLASQIDDTGRIWYFVVMDKPSKPGYHNYKIYSQEKWMGWMSSKYVDIINYKR